MSQFLLIGSVALKNAIGLPTDRNYNDVDIIANYPNALTWLKNKRCLNIIPMNKGKTLVGKDPKGLIHEASIAWPNSTNEELLEWVGDAVTAPLDVLYALKMSHRYLRNSPHFYKTMADIKLMRKKGAKIPDSLEDWFKRREKETYDYKHPSLAQDKQGFFSGDGVNYQYDHDSLHQAVAMRGTPLYKFYQSDNNEVQCDKNKWNMLSEYNKNCAVAEEAAVLALERSLIPYPGVLSDYEAFKLALMKICTSITSGWFREHAWENHDNILKLIEDYPYKTFFEYGLKKGVVKSYVK